MPTINPPPEVRQVAGTLPLHTAMLLDHLYREMVNAHFQAQERHWRIMHGLRQVSPLYPAYHQTVFDWYEKGGLLATLKL
jgi:hypothetical protein